MKRLSILIGILMMTVVLSAQTTGRGQGTPRGTGDPATCTYFVDENGDGFNDNAPDVDGDGIPNGQDEDFVRPQDGSRSGGKGYGRNQSRGNRGRGRMNRTNTTTETSTTTSGTK